MKPSFSLWPKHITSVYPLISYAVLASFFKNLVNKKSVIIVNLPLFLLLIGSSFLPAANANASLATYNNIIFSGSSASQLYLMKPDGSDITRITYEQNTYSQPVASPDGSKIAFVSGTGNWVYNIYVMNLDGSNKIQLTNDGQSICPVWSPDGTKLVFNTYVNNSFQIGVMNSDGSNQTLISPGNIPTWSSDGKRIIYTAGGFNGSGYSYAIYSMNPDGSGQTKIIDTGDVYHLSCSPDGSKISFSMAVNGTQIYSINSDGTDLIQLTHFSGLGTNNGPNWSPDGSKIVFDIWAANDHDIYTMNPDGSDQTYLPDSVGGAVPSWLAPILPVSVGPSGWINQSSTAIESDLVDDGSGINFASLAVRVDGNALSGCSINNLHESCAVSGLSEGNHQTSIYYRSNDGKTGIGFATLDVDVTGPSITAISPAAWSNPNQTISASIADYTSGVDSASIYVYLDSSIQPLSSCTTSTSSVSCPVTGLANGMHMIHISAKDNAGNSSSATSAFTVETAPPSITNSIPVGHLTINNASVSAYYSDVDSGVNIGSVRLKINGVDVTSRSNIFPNHIIYYDQNQGEQDVQLTACDNVGNCNQANWSFSMPKNYYFTWYDNQMGHMTWVLGASPSGSPENSLDIYLHGQPLMKGLQVNSGMTVPEQFVGQMNGPVSVISQNDPSLISERSLFGNSFEEIWATPYTDLDSHYYWPMYNGNSQSRPFLIPSEASLMEWILVANPIENGEVVQADLSFWINSNIYTYSQTIQPGTSWTPVFPGVGAHDVEVKAHCVGNYGDARKVIASERILMNGAFNEMPGIPASRLSSDYVWTWFDSISGTDAIAIGNPSGGFIYVTVSVGGVAGSPHEVDPNQVVYWTGGSNKFMYGPVEVTACYNNNTGPCNNPAPIYASQASVLGQGYEEIAGTSVSDLKPTSNWTWYDEQAPGAMNWILVANPNDSPIYYEINIPGVDPATTPGASGTLDPGQNNTPRFHGVVGGPVQVKAWTDSSKTTPANVMASQRVLWNGYFNEVVGQGM